MKTILSILVLGSLLLGNVQAQNFTITIAPGDFLTAGGDVMNHSNQASLGVNIFFAQTQPFTNFFDSAGAPDASDFASYGNLSWITLQQTTAGGGAFEFWTQPGGDGSSANPVTGTAGNTVLIALTTADSVGQTTAGDDVAFLASINPLSNVGQAALNLASFNILAGETGSVQMVSAVPEPSAYAALAGCLALGWVMVRRRRA